MTSVRVVISGVGGCTPLGGSLAEVGEALRAGRLPFVPSRHWPDFAVAPAEPQGDMARAAAPDAALRLLGGWRHRHYCHRGAQLAVLAGLRAALDAQPGGEEGPPSWTSLLPDDTPLLLAAGPMLDVSGEPGLPPGDVNRLGALWLLRWLPNTGAAALCRFLGLHGESLTLNAACASALQALGEGFRRIRRGEADRVLVAAGDSRLSEVGLLGYARAQTLSRRGPDCGPRPFDQARDGFVAAEGGAAFVLESLEAATARGARIHAELLGYGASSDGGSLTAPDEQGRYAERAVRAALAEAAGNGMADGPHWVSAHGTGTERNDAVEAALVERLFAGMGTPPAVMALKSRQGHASAAAGAVELLTLLAAWRTGFMPSIAGLERPCSAHLAFVREETPFVGPLGLLENFGFGGQNAALVVRLWT